MILTESYRYQIRMHRGEKEAHLPSLLRRQQRQSIQLGRDESRAKSQVQTGGDQKKSFQLAMLIKIFERLLLGS